jgi:drug/metabolite transporter (DMT)-like permease
VPSTRRNALLLLHFTILIWGSTGILGKLIEQPTAHIVLVRVIIGAAGLLAYAVLSRTPLMPIRKEIPNYVFTGVLIAAHWIAFYGAIKLSSASIAAACLSTSTLFTALMEPFWFKRKILFYEVVLGAIVIAALGLIFGLEMTYRTGILVAVLSSFLSAWFNIVNGVLIKRDNAVRIGFYEMLTVLVVMYAWAFGTNDLPQPIWNMPARDMWSLLALGLVCTTFAFVAGIAVMKVLTPFTVMLAVNLEPVYTIIIALLIWPESETMRPGSYAGIALILICLFVNGWLQRRRPAEQIVEPDPLTQG